MGSSTMTFDECTVADRKGKVQKAQAKTVTGEAKKCYRAASALRLHRFGDRESGAVEGALWLTCDIFGDPVDDAASSRRPPTRTRPGASSRCQAGRQARGHRPQGARQGQEGGPQGRDGQQR